MRLATLFGLFLLPNWLQGISVAIWLAAIGGTLYAGQFWIAALMAIGFIVIGYARYQYGRGRSFLGRVYHQSGALAEQLVQNSRGVLNRRRKKSKAD